MTGRVLAVRFWWRVVALDYRVWSSLAAETERTTMVAVVAAAVVFAIGYILDAADSSDGQLMRSELMHCMRTCMDSI